MKKAILLILFFITFQNASYAYLNIETDEFNGLISASTLERHFNPDIGLEFQLIAVKLPGKEVDDFIVIKICREDDFTSPHVQFKFDNNVYDIFYVEKPTSKEIKKEGNIYYWEVMSSPGIFSNRIEKLQQVKDITVRVTYVDKKTDILKNYTFPLEKETVKDWKEVANALSK